MPCRLASAGSASPPAARQRPPYFHTASLGLLIFLPAANPPPTPADARPPVRAADLLAEAFRH